MFTTISETIGNSNFILQSSFNILKWNLSHQYKHSKPRQSKDKLTWYLLRENDGRKVLQIFVLYN